MRLVDIQFLAAMGPPGGGRNPITERFLRHFNVIGVTTFNDETMSRIFSSLVNFYLKSNSFPPEFFATGTQIVQATLEVCNYTEYWSGDIWGSVLPVLPSYKTNQYLFS